MMDHSGFDWTYHGLGETGHATWRILVEPAMFGTTERHGLKALRELHSPAGSGGFSWGYNGGGPARCARLILANALQVDHRWEDSGDRAAVDLRIDFTWDVVSQLAHEWRMRRSAVLRWIRGWYADKGIAQPPRATVGLPPASPFGYERLRNPPRPPGT